MSASRRMARPRPVITTGRGEPSRREGTDGSLTIRDIDGVITLFAKYQGRWHETPLGDHLVLGSQHIGHLQIGSHGVDAMANTISKANFSSTIRIGENTADKSALRVAQDGTITMGTSSTTLVHVKADATAVGIGTTNPTGALHIQSNQHSDIVPQLLIESTSSGASTAPDLVLKRSPATGYGEDNDYIGQIIFSGEADDGSLSNYCHIRGFVIDSGSSGSSEDSAIYFMAQKAGSSKNTLAISQDNVGINTVVPANTLSVAPIQYSTGTASQTDYTVTGSGTVWTSAMIGSEFVYADRTSSGAITARASNTSITVTTSQTVSSQAYSIHYQGLQLTSDGNAGIGTASPGQKLEVNGSIKMSNDADDIVINDATVLSKTTLGSGVIGSSLTSVGTIGTGTWEGTAIDKTRGGFGADVSASTWKLSSLNRSFADGRSQASKAMVLDSTGSFKMQSITSVKSGFNLEMYSDTVTDKASLRFRKSQFDTAVGTIETLSGAHHLGEIVFQGADTGGAFDDGAIIRAIADNSLGTDASDMPAKLEFLTTPNDTSDAEVRMSILSTGAVTIDGAFAPNHTSGSLTAFGNTATPSVAAGNLFTTYASGALTLTTLDDGIIGQIVTIISASATTFDFDADNFKCGTADIVTASGDVTQWVFDGTNWYLLSWMDVSANLADGSAGGF